MGRPSANTTDDVPRLRRSHGEIPGGPGDAPGRVRPPGRIRGAGFLRTTFKAICSSQVCHTRGHWEPPLLSERVVVDVLFDQRRLCRAVLPATSLAADRAAR